MISVSLTESVELWIERARWFEVPLPPGFEGKEDHVGRDAKGPEKLGVMPS